MMNAQVNHTLIPKLKDASLNVLKDYMEIKMSKNVKNVPLNVKHVHQLINV